MAPVLVEPMASNPNSCDTLRRDISPVRSEPEIIAEESTAFTLRPNSSSKNASSSDHPEVKDKLPSYKLRRFGLILSLTIVFAFLAVFAWTVTCILVHRPLTTSSYALHLKYNDSNGYGYPRHSVYESNERLFQAVRVIQAIVAVATIPLTSGVCSIASVAFVQRARGIKRLSLRKTMVLADRGWADFEVLFHLLRGRGGRYGSWLLYLAIALVSLGAIISPVQSIFLSTKTVQTPAYLGYVSRLTDIPDRFGDYNGEDPDNMLAPAQLRSAVTSTTSTDPQVRLWTAAGALNCTNSTAQTSNACASGQISLRNMSLLHDPFVAQLPAGYNTGLVRQFMPRINSTVYRERIAPGEFPPDCGNLHNSFYVNYSDIVMTGFDGGKPVGISWSLVACMPSDQRQSPWRNTQERQDFSEILFLNLSAYAPNPTPTTVDPDLWSGYFKLTMNTTAGYFELPNYMNDQIPGPLLDDTPVSQCGTDCLQQNNPYTAACIGESSRRRDTLPETNDTTEITDASFSLSTVANKPPLLTIAMALFGPGSFIADRTAHPDVYVNENVTSTSLSCTERAPFLGLLATTDNLDLSAGNGLGDLVQCITNNNWNFGFLQDTLRTYVQAFIGPDPFTVNPVDQAASNLYDAQLENAFNAAAFLSNQLWLTSSSEANLVVNYDLGAPTQVPHISHSGIILISVLLSLFLVGLLAMAMYGTWDPHYTSRLDSFSMMQMGAAISDHLPFYVANDIEKFRILDETPGWIGDEKDGHEEAGELGLGAMGPVKAKRQYRCFERPVDESAKGKRRAKRER